MRVVSQSKSVVSKVRDLIAEVTKFWSMKERRKQLKSCQQGNRVDSLTKVRELIAKEKELSAKQET